MTVWDTRGGRGATGVWLVGARGSVAVTTIAGTAALCAGLVRPTGCVTAQRELSRLDLPRFDDLVFGGHDIGETPLVERAERLAGEGVMPPGLPRLVRDGLLAAEEEVRPGATGAGDGPGGRGPRDGREAQEEAIRRLAGDISSFRLRLGLDRVVVVNVASPGPGVPRHPAHASLPALRRALAAGEDVLSDASLYACAALRADCPYVDLTSPAGLRLPALRELAAERELPYAGGDGRTGGALLKSVLAPMFAQRALSVSSWSDGRTDGRGGGGDSDGGSGGHGGSDGDSGAGSGRRAARDQVSFEGFLGVPMALRFTWQGCEPALAAPLVLDLARLMALADRAGVRGPVPELAFFFQEPLREPLREPVPGGAPGGEGRSPAEQYATLVAWAHGLRVPV